MDAPNSNEKNGDSKDHEKCDWKNEGVEDNILI